MRGRKPGMGMPLLILLVAWALLTVRLDAPWFGIAEENGAWISAAVRNYRLYGADNLWLMQVLNAGPATPETCHYYVHHPPLVVWSGCWEPSSLSAMIRAGQRLCWALFVVGVGYLLLFRNAGYIHIYYKIFLAPPLPPLAARRSRCWRWQTRLLPIPRRAI